MVGFAILVLGGVVLAAFLSQAKPSPGVNLDEFANCITNAGGKMYGASWCSNCSNQKEDFGSSFKYINYVECSPSNVNDLSLCTDQDINAVPVWETKEGYQSIGRQKLSTLAQMFSCTLPEEYVE
jgi:hypothetical protein